MCALFSLALRLRTTRMPMYHNCAMPKGGRLSHTAASLVSRKALCMSPHHQSRMMGIRIKFSRIYISAALHTPPSLTSTRLLMIAINTRDDALKLVHALW